MINLLATFMRQLMGTMQKELGLVCGSMFGHVQIIQLTYNGSTDSKGALMSDHDGRSAEIVVWHCSRCDRTGWLEHTSKGRDMSALKRAQQNHICRRRFDERRRVFRRIDGFEGCEDG